VSSSSTETLIDVLMPQLGTSMSEGTVVSWAKRVGDTVERDEPICEITTDKIDSDCPAPAAGVLAEILVEVGETVETGTVLARIATGDSADVLNGDGPPRQYSPVVNRMAAAHDIDLESVPGTGRNGRVTKKDIEAYLARTREPEPTLHSDSPYVAEAAAEPPSASPAAGPPAATPPAAATAAAAATPPAGEPTQLSRMRQSIGAAMRTSLDTAATCTTIVECDVTAVERQRRELGLTALPLVARHVIDTLRDFPDLNATLEATTFTRYDAVHLGVAVSLGDDGLIVPVIRDAQQLAPQGLAERIKELAGRARSGALTPDDVRGGTFTITSPGAFGALIATPIINVPQVAILDFETIARRPVVVTDPDGNESIAIRSMVYLCLSWDHRAIDGAYAARFLTALRGRIESV